MCVFVDHWMYEMNGYRFEYSAFLCFEKMIIKIAMEKKAKLHSEMPVPVMGGLRKIQITFYSV